MDKVEITRKNALKLGGATLATLGLASTEAEAVVKPNILFILLDDMPERMLNRENMPNTVNRIQDKGLVFDQFYANNPQCGPARAMIMKGLYTHRASMPKTNENPNTWSVFKDIMGDTLATRINNAGYRTGLFGKFINGYSQASVSTKIPGWDRWFASNGGQDDGPFMVNDDGVQREFSGPKSQKMFDEAKTWIGGGIDSNPWFCYLAPDSPHAPYGDTSTRYADRTHTYDGATYTSPGIEEDSNEELADKPQYIQNEAPYTQADAERTQYHTEGKKEELRAIDDLIGNLLDFLYDRGELENTLIFLTADNGMLMGEHGGIDGKHEPYEEAAKTPAVVRGPGIPQGIRTGALTGLIDVCQTLVRYAGGSTTGYEGRSLHVLFDGTMPSTWRQWLLLEGPAYDWFAIRDDALPNVKRKYIQRPVRDEYYNLTVDPYETNNRKDEAGNEEQMANLLNKLNSMKTCSGDNCRTRERP